jgi:hypothetical protein
MSKSKHVVIQYLATGNLKVYAVDGEGILYRSPEEAVAAWQANLLREAARLDARAKKLRLLALSKPEVSDDPSI